MTAENTPAHDQAVTHHYTVHYPEHGPRESDPYYSDFHAYKKRRKTEGTYYCDFAQEFRNGDASECDLTKPLECHHKHIEFSFQNGVDPKLLEPHFPGISKMSVGQWIESDENLQLLCVAHHRGRGGVHVAAYADFEGEKFIRGLIS